MSNTGGNNFQQLLSKFAAGVQRRDPSVLGQILGALERIPGEPNLLHLAGLYNLNTENHSVAIDYFLQSLKQFPAQPELLNNLANAYRAVDDLSAAERHYRKSLALQPTFLNAWKNLGLLLIRSERYEEAEQALRSALDLVSNDISVLTALGDLYRAQHRYDAALSYYQQALDIQPNYPNALHNQGACFKALEQPDQAMLLYRRAQQAAPQLAEVDLSIGNTLFDLGQYQNAERHFLQAIEKSPQMVEAHETLSELYWQTDRHDEIERSFRQALRQVPHNIAMRLSLLGLLTASGRFDAAQQLAQDSLKISRHPDLLYAQGKLFANELNYTRARECFQQALQQASNLDCAQDLMKLHILQADYQAALELINSSQQEHPHDQLNWALKGLCWRLLGDERYEWLLDYNTHIRAYALPTPAGYKSLDEFLAELQETLLGMHSTQFAPSRQTLKGGTQTPGRLLHKKNPVIQTYRNLLREVVGEYIEALPRDVDHPLLNRQGVDFEFSGSWSVKLQAGGYHVNHVHPQGWISSSCYITMPPHQQGVSLEQQACIKFGESGLGLGEREIVERVIQPKAGMLVLFPSYTWHGTYDFDGDDQAIRLTAPFDVMPIDARS
ncbi:MAG: tetratricopeptide repeat protein [Pseudomonadales bacterium]